VGKGSAFGAPGEGKGKGKGKGHKTDGSASAKPLYKQPTLQFYRGPDVTDNVFVPKSGKSKFVDIGKQFVSDRKAGEEEEDEALFPGFERDVGNVFVYDQQFQPDPGDDGLPHAGDGGKGSSAKEGERGKEGRSNANKSAPSCRPGSVEGSSAAGADESAYDRLVRRPLYNNVLRAGRRWIYTVKGSSTTEAEKRKAVNDLKHWCTHPLLPEEKRHLEADAHAFFTDRALRDPSQALFCDMALSMHSISATEFGCKRLFSLIHHIIGPHRSSLAGDAVIALALHNAQAKEKSKQCMWVCLVCVPTGVRLLFG
jgi:hypothetical protein